MALRTTRNPDDTIVALRGLKEGNRFCTSLGNRPEDEMIRLYNGEIAYEILGYAKDIKEYHMAVYGRTFN